MTPSSNSYFTGYKTTATVTEGYAYSDISLQDNLRNGEGTAVAVHDFYIQGTDADHFAFSSAYSAVNINKHTSLSRGASSPFYLFFDLGMPAGVYTADLVVVTAVGTYKSTFSVTVEAKASSTPSTGTTTTPSIPSGDNIYPITGTTVNYPTQEQIAKFYFDSAKDAIATPTTYASEPYTSSPYSPGVLSDATNQGALTTVNYIRYIAGLDYKVTLVSPM